MNLSEQVKIGGKSAHVDLAYNKQNKIPLTQKCHPCQGSESVIQ